MISYTWSINQLDRLTSDNFVVTVHYNVSAVDGDFTASTYGTVSYTQESDNFIPFENLTPAIVIGWVKESLGEETVEASLASQIDALKNPVQVSGLPWSQNA